MKFIYKLLVGIAYRYDNNEFDIGYRYGKGPVKKCFWMAACATYPAAHQRAMKTLERYSKPAHEQLMKLNPASWSRAYFQTHCFADNVENNMSECFNSWIVNERYHTYLMPCFNTI